MRDPMGIPMNHYTVNPTGSYTGNPLDNCQSQQPSSRQGPTTTKLEATAPPQPSGG